MTDYPMCPTCRIADFEVQMARDVRGDCPHCGSPTWESLRCCCIPGCDKSLPVTELLPVCRSCGVKIALAHLSEASKFDVVMAEAKRSQEERQRLRTNGKPGASVVYYVKLDENRIKIGFTSKPRERLRAFRVHPSALLAYEPGGRDVERQRHTMFAAERLGARVEEFEPSERLMEWIADLRKARDLPAWAKVPDTRVVKRTA